MNLDQQIQYLGREINQLQAKPEQWAKAKVGVYQEIQASLHALKDFQQDLRADGVPRTMRG